MIVNASPVIKPLSVIKLSPSCYNAFTCIAHDDGDLMPPSKIERKEPILRLHEVGAMSSTWSCSTGLWQVPGSRQPEMPGKVDWIRHGSCDVAPGGWDARNASKSQPVGMKATTLATQIAQSPYQPDLAGCPEHSKENHRRASLFERPWTPCRCRHRVLWPSDLFHPISLSLMLRTSHRKSFHLFHPQSLQSPDLFDQRSDQANG